MHLKLVELHNFMSHRATTVELPSRGVVLVTGQNGAGKSALVEALSFGLWGKTLRGSSPWAEERGASVRVVADSVEVSRTPRALSWSLAGQAPTKYENKTKAQDALLPHVGSWELWKRSCVFSSADAAHFSMASDGERKRLLEAMLGLHRFDVAAVRCRAESQAAEAALHAASLASTQAAAEVRSLTERVNDARNALQTEPREDVEDLRQRLASVASYLAAAQHDDGKAREVVYALPGYIRTTRTRAAQLQATLDKLGAAQVCPTCARPVDPSSLCADIEAAERELAHLREEEATCSKQLADAQAALSEAREEVELLSSQQRELTAALRVAEVTARRRVESEANLATLDARRVRALDELARAGGEVARFERRVGLLRHVDKTLGLRGARATMLHRALASLEALCNANLARVARDDLRVVFSETDANALLMEVVGAGGGAGYKGASSGERRRLDVAILLALGELAAACAGKQVGTLFFDEVLDTLDGDGVQAVCDLIRALSSERCVVVVSHTTDVQRALNPALHWHVSGGKVRPV